MTVLTNKIPYTKLPPVNTSSYSKHFAFLLTLICFAYFIFTTESVFDASLSIERIRQVAVATIRDPQIAIVVVITAGSNMANYDVATKSVHCYANAQGYHFVLAMDDQYGCKHKDKFFRRHCVAAKILPKYDAVLFLDADIGVVNPKKRIEEYMDDDIDVTFYDRFYNWEIMAGSYIARNTPYALDLLMEFADYEFKLPNSFHGTDNGALHLFLAKKLVAHARIEIENCEKAYNKSRGYEDLFTYEACIRSLLGVSTNIGKVKIYRKGTGWARDDWLSGGVWNDEIDFMLHGWKMNQLKATPDKPRAWRMGNAQWYNPFIGTIQIEKCLRYNTTWAYDSRLIANRTDVETALLDYEKSIAFDQIKSVARMVQLLTKN